MGTTRRHAPRARFQRAARSRGLIQVVALAATLAVVVAGCAASSSPWPGGRWRQGPEQYGVEVVHDVPIPMRDGVTLKADIGFPTDLATGERADGPFPVLLSQDPYWGVFQPDGYFVTRGYIYVVMDTRNSTARSAVPVTADQELFGPGVAEDGVDAVDFVAHELEGSNGTVGLVGCSFLGITQLFTAAAVGPGSPVKAMVPTCASFGYEMHFEGGIPGMLLGAYAINPFATGPAPVTGNFSQALAAEVGAGGDRAYHREFWHGRDTTELAPTIVANDIPTLLWSGWQALEGQGAVELYDALQNASIGRDPRAAIAPNQPVTGRYQIVMGADGHGAGLDASFQLQWFDRWLKGDRNGIDDTTTPMHLHEAGSNRWINVPRLPVAPTTAYQLGAGGVLSTDGQPRSSATLRWAAPTEQDASLAYTSSPLTAPMSIAGPITATIHARSSTTNLELLATLHDVAPDGTTTRISEGALIGSMRAVDESTSWTEADGRMIKPIHPFTHDDPLVPGVDARFDVALHTAVYQLPAGHSLRLVLSTQPVVADCWNPLEIFGRSLPCNPTAPQQASLAGSVYTIELGGRGATMLNVPLVAPDALPTPLACKTPMNVFVEEPMDWQSGTYGPRDPAADAAACFRVWG